MKRINIKDIYPSQQKDTYIWIEDDIASVFKDAAREELNYRRRRYRNHAHFSLDRNDGMENEILFLSTSPDEYYERKVTIRELYSAIAALPQIQSRRLHAHFFLNMSLESIAHAEGVSIQAIHVAIQRGLRSLEKTLRKKFSP